MRNPRAGRGRRGGIQHGSGAMSKVAKVPDQLEMSWRFGARVRGGAMPRAAASSLHIRGTRQSKIAAEAIFRREVGAGAGNRTLSRDLATRVIHAERRKLCSIWVRLDPSSTGRIHRGGRCRGTYAQHEARCWRQGPFAGRRGFQGTICAPVESARFLSNVQSGIPRAVLADSRIR